MMKQLAILACLLVLFCLDIQAQNQVQIREETRNMSLGSFNCLVLDLPSTSKKDVIKLWEDHAKSFKAKKTSYNKKTDEIFSDDAILKEISPNTVDVYAKVNETATGTEISVWFNVGLNYLSSREFPQQYLGGEKVMRDFAGSLALELLEGELKTQEKALGNLESDLKKLEKDKSSKEKDIEDNRKAIQKAEENIKKLQEEVGANEVQQGSKKQEIDTQKTVVEDIKAKIRDAKNKKR